jgi:sigma-B regulation protein RsbU (phosphoserine phosphatase)
MKKLEGLLPFLLVLGISIAIIVWLFPLAHQYGGITLPFDRETMIDRSRALLDSLGADLTGLHAEVRLVEDRALIRQTQVRFGIEKSNSLLRDSISAYAWEIQWTKQRPSFYFGNDEGDARKALVQGEFHLHLDNAGRLERFQRKIDDSARVPSLALAEAKILAYSFLKRYSPVAGLIADTSAIVFERQIQQPNRTDHEFVWKAQMPLLGDTVQARIAVAGNCISSYNLDTRVPGEFTHFESGSVMKVLLIILYIVAGIGFVVVAFQKIRSYEIGFRLAVLAGVLAAVCFDVQTLLEIQSTVDWSIAFVLLIIPIFIGGAVVLLWAVGESLVRETWKEKFNSFDLISKGHFYHSHLGTNTIRGVAIGLAGLALNLVLVHFLGGRFGMWTLHSEMDTLHTFDTAAPWLYALSNNFYGTAFVFSFFILFLVSVLRKVLASVPLLIAAGACAMAVFESGKTGPAAVVIGVSILVNALFVWSYCRYDALATFSALFTFSLAQEAGGLFAAGGPVFEASAWIIAGLFAALFIVSIASLFRRKEITDFDAVTPAFAKHITERQRLQQEFEIAKSVQLSFLPKSNPEMPQVDIASRCVPAQEVGGDYYDFIEIGPKKLAVAIGDVSGKGTQAAFFMTLTKGFLRALANTSDSPAKVLIQLNRLFFENVGRGIFSSMIYGVFNTAKKSLAVACAGHNPVIVWKSRHKSLQVVSPSGLALGLDAGAKFARSIREARMKYQAGDVFVFYTDGFTEAMNKTEEEFGEERLVKAVEALADGTAEEIMEGVFEKVRSFVGKARPHDDMTIIVVKIRP